MNPGGPPPTPGPPPSDPASPRLPLPLALTPHARVAIEDLLRIRPRGYVVHLSILPGTPPIPRMRLRPAAQGEVVSWADGLPFVIDPGSDPFLSGATIEYRSEEGFAFFEITGPGLAPARSGPRVPRPRVERTTHGSKHGSGRRRAGAPPLRPRDAR